MQYLDFELYKKISCIKPKKEDEKKWNDSLKKWLIILKDRGRFSVLTSWLI